MTIDTGNPPYDRGLLTVLPYPALILNSNLQVETVNSPAEDFFDDVTSLPGTKVTSVVPDGAPKLIEVFHQLDPGESTSIRRDFDGNTRDKCCLTAGSFPSADRYLLIVDEHEKNSGSKRMTDETEIRLINDLFRHTEKLGRAGGWEYEPSRDDLRWTDGTRRIHDVPMDYEPDVETAINFYHPDDRETIRQKLENCRRQGKSYDLELRLITANDDLKWVRTRGEKVQRNNRTVLRGAIRDITEQKSKQRELLTKTEAMDAVKEGITIADARGDDNPIIYCNDGFVELTGYDREAILGKNCRFLQGPKTDPETVREIREAIRNETAITTEILNYRKDDTTFWNLLSITPVYRNSELTHFIGIQKDISERKASEQALEARRKELARSNKQLKHFANLVTHDLKQPLRTITSFIELLQGRFAGELPEDGHHYLDRIEDGARNMAEQMDGLREFSKVSSSEARFESIDLNEPVAAARANLQEDIDAADATIIVGDLAVVNADRKLLETAFQNLLSNSVKYSGDQPPEINIKGYRQENNYVVSVSDRGIGIDPKYHDKIFELFERLHTDDSVNGTGIGLALVQKIMKIHEGEIRVKSTPGEGTRFELVFPLAEPP